MADKEKRVKSVDPATIQMLEKAESLGKTIDLYTRMILILTKMERFDMAASTLEKAKKISGETAQTLRLENHINNEKKNVGGKRSCI